MSRQQQKKKRARRAKIVTGQRSIGDRLGGYELVSKIGSGGMADVYHARHHLEGDVAVKVLRASFASNPAIARRFKGEAIAAARIQSDRVANVIDAGVVDGEVPYIVMELVEGETLAARLDRVGSMGVRELYPLAVQLLQGLIAAHDAGIVHRDLKPSNVFLVTEHPDGRDFVKIIDFGISKFENEGDVTKTGVVLGTPHYMAPEQARGARLADERSDLYSVGVIMFKALSGETPHKSDSWYDWLARVVSQPPRELRHVAPYIDEALGELIHKALRRSAECRYQSADEMLQVLEAWGDDRDSMLPVPSPTSISIPSIDRDLAGTLESDHDELFELLDGDSISQRPTPMPMTVARREQTNHVNRWLAAAFVATFFLTILVLSQLAPHRNHAPAARTLTAMTPMAMPGPTMVSAPEYLVFYGDLIAEEDEDEDEEDEEDDDGADDELDDAGAKPKRRVVRHRYVSGDIDADIDAQFDKAK